MSESYDSCMFVREPDHLLEIPFKIEGDVHNFDHTTWFIMGYWRVTCWDMLPDGSGWASEPCMRVHVQGGLPGARLLIKAKRKHTLELLKGPGNYGCAYPHRKEDGTIVPFYYGWLPAFFCPDKSKPTLKFATPAVTECFVEPETAP